MDTKTNWEEEFITKFQLGTSLMEAQVKFIQATLKTEKAKWSEVNKLKRDRYAKYVEERLGRDKTYPNELYLIVEETIKETKDKFKEIVISSTPSHITRDYNETDQMRDEILNKLK